MKLLLYAAYASSLPFIFLHQLSLSEMQLYLKLAVELRPSLFGYATVTAFRFGDERKTSRPSKVFKRTENKGRMQAWAQSLTKTPKRGSLPGIGWLQWAWCIIIQGQKLALVIGRSLFSQDITYQWQLGQAFGFHT